MSLVEKIKQKRNNLQKRLEKEPYPQTNLDSIVLQAGIGLLDDVLEILSDYAIVEKQKLLVKLLRLTKPRAGSIYSIQQEEGMMLLLTELLVGVKPRSRNHVEGLLHNLKYGFTAKGPKSKTIKKLMVLMGESAKKEVENK